jgi:hypothetical protein
MYPGGGGQPDGEVLELIERDFGLFEEFAKEFTLTTFGVVFHIFPIDFPHCCHAFDDSYHGLYVTNM